jgi:hypothetical protein
MSERDKAHELEQIKGILKPGNLIWGTRSADATLMRSILQGLKPRSMHSHQSPYNRDPQHVTFGILPRLEPGITTEQEEGYLSYAFSQTGSFGPATDHSGIACIVDNARLLADPRFRSATYANGKIFYNKYYQRGNAEYSFDIQTSSDGNKTSFGIPIQGVPTGSATLAPHINEVTVVYPNDGSLPPIGPSFWSGMVIEPRLQPMIRDACAEMQIPVPPLISFQEEQVGLSFSLLT